MNYKRKHPSKRKFRYLRRGWNGEGKQELGYKSTEIGEIR